MTRKQSSLTFTCLGCRERVTVFGRRANPHVAQRFCGPCGQAERAAAARTRSASRRAMGVDLTSSERAQMFNDHGNVCAACGSTFRLQQDHIIPVSRGGTKERSNLRPLCGPCNSSKGSKLDSEWLS